MAEYQGFFDWANAWARGIHFGWYRVSGGGKDPLHLDLQGARNRAESRRAGVHSMGYHFWLGGRGVTARQQLDFFTKQTGRVQPGDIRPMLDFEDPPDYTRPGQSLPIVLSQEECRVMVQGCLQFHGVLPVIYAGEMIYRRFLWFEKEIEGCPRNIPNYSSTPTRPHDVHQYTATKRIAGYTSDLDADRTLDLRRLLI